MGKLLILCKFRKESVMSVSIPGTGEGYKELNSDLNVDSVLRFMPGLNLISYLF